ncbi:putative membrane protein (plasmid) [Nostoc flagelliforme CCNUN1]|uniref:Putative membrane protein n=1 Tax=Nostoc flagelliforme CCNUN1 TaxID=2038116 RepID=A0A2K8T910_9NOSO|nr:putative membrane protein [Nostoc flagelliforme CCNUN1]
MLIAPFAGPAMNTAIATAWGDRKLLGRSILRYFSALAVTIATTWLLSLILRQEIPTSLMVESSQVSAVAVILPLAAGAAGALNLMQSERSSLVSGAATGMLVAASLAPPAGIVGMASAIGRWDMVISELFLLFLQLCGINFSASLLFRIFRLSAQGTRYGCGKKRVFFSALAITVIALALLLTWQFSHSPNLQRSSLAQRANAQVQKTVEQVGLAKLVESNVRFTRSNIEGQDTLLSVVYVQRQPGVTASSEEIRARLTQSIQTQLLKQDLNVTPLVDVKVLETPASKQ